MQSPLDIGVDVAKEAIVVACARQTFAPHSVSNRRRALAQWLRTLPKGSRIGVEATGSYHQWLTELAAQAGFTVFVLNPKDVRHYAKATGQRAKTERVDAELIARYIAHEQRHLHPYTPPTPAQRRIDLLIKRRAKLVTLKGALKLSLEGMPGFATELKAVVTRLNRLLAKLDAALRELLRQCTTQPIYQRLQTIVGVGPLVSASLTNALERVPFRNADAFVAFTGLDPRPHDSGRKIGRRRLSKRGPAELRRLLFNAAMAGAKTKTWKPIYAHHRAKGLSTTAALVIIARKIARTAWSIHHYNTTFDPNRLSRALT